MSEKNKHKYMVYVDPSNVLSNEMSHKIGGELTKAYYSNLCSHGTCSKCGSEPGYYCQTPKGRKVWPPHTERTLPPEVEVQAMELSKVKTTTLADLIEGNVVRFILPGLIHQARIAKPRAGIGNSRTGTGSASNIYRER